MFCFHSAFILLLLRTGVLQKRWTWLKARSVCLQNNLATTTCFFSYCMYVVCFCVSLGNLFAVGASVYLHYLFSQILKHTHTKRPQDSLYRQPQPAKSHFFLSLRKAEDNTYFHLPNQSCRIFWKGYLYNHQRILNILKKEGKLPLKDKNSCTVFHSYSQRTNTWMRQTDFTWHFNHRRFDFHVEALPLVLRLVSPWK